MPTVAALRDLCRESHIRGYSSANKTTLIELLEAAGVEVPADTAPSSKRSTTSSTSSPRPKAAPISPQPYVVRSFFASLAYVKVHSANVPAYLEATLANGSVNIYAIYGEHDDIPQEYRVIDKANDKYEAVAVDSKEEVIPASIPSAVATPPVRTPVRAAAARKTATVATPPSPAKADSTHYKLRAEAQADVDTFFELAEGDLTHIVNDNSSGEIELSFHSALDEEMLLEMLRQIDDGHVMVQTLAKAEDYTGERNYEKE